MPALVEQRAIAAVVLAAFGLALVPFAVLSVIYGVRALRAIKRRPGIGGKRMAIASIVASIASIGWWTFVLIDQIRG